MSAPEPHRGDVEEFFEKTIPDQIHLTAIDPEKRHPTVAKDFGTDADAAVEWAQERNVEGWNVYYTVNRVREGVNKKPSKADIAAARFAHVDIDPPKGQASFEVPEREAAYQELLAATPSMVIWSGNGWQGLWRLPAGVSIAEAEDINCGLIDGLGGDRGTYDASRLLRVPGLVNWPDAHKRELGRKPELSLIVDEDDGSIADPHELRAKFPAGKTPRQQDVPSRASVDLGEIGLLTADDLGLDNDHHLRRLIEEPKGLDRSADTFRFACEALRHGLTDADRRFIVVRCDDDPKADE